MKWVLWFLTGGVVGWLTILTHVWSAARLAHDSPDWYVWALMSGSFLRWAIVATLFVVALQQDVIALLAAFGGLWLVRRFLLFRLNAGLAFSKLLR